MKYNKRLIASKKIYKAYILFTTGKRLPLNGTETAEFDLFIRQKQNLQDPAYNLASICHYCFQPYYPSRLSQKYCWNCEPTARYHRAKNKKNENTNR
jgi:hypothetical protein